MTTREKWMAVIIFILVIFLIAFYNDSHRSEHVKSGAYSRDMYNQCRAKGGDDLGCWREYYGD
jgi:hypothetical protein